MILIHLSYQPVMLLSYFRPFLKINEQRQGMHCLCANGVNEDFEL